MFMALKAQKSKMLLFESNEIYLMKYPHLVAKPFASSIEAIQEKGVSPTVCVRESAQASINTGCGFLLFAQLPQALQSIKSKIGTAVTTERSV